MENFSDFHNRMLFDKYELEIKCPECRSEDVLIGFDEGYFWICECRKCGYKNEKKIS